MTTKHDMAVAMATEIGKQVPVKQVYEDAGSPAVRQVGATLEDVVKCIRLVGFPIQWLAVQQDRFRSFIERAKDHVPHERRILPAPQILGPILEGVRYELDDTPIVDMFAKLLGSAMDAENVDKVFPSFASIIKSLSVDEAKILKYLQCNEIEVLYRNGGEIEDVMQGENEYLVSMIDLRFPNYKSIYIDHLFSHNLLAWNSDAQEITVRDGIHVTKSMLKLSLTGKYFMAACSGESVDI